MIGDACVPHQQAASNFSATALHRALAEAADWRKRKKYTIYGRAGACAFDYLPLSHETHGRAGAAAIALLSRLADGLQGLV